MKKPTIASLSKQVKEMEEIIFTQRAKLNNQEVLLKNSEDVISKQTKAIQSNVSLIANIETELEAMTFSRDEYQERANNQADTIRQLYADIDGFKRRHTNSMADIKNAEQEASVHLKVAQEFRSIIISALNSKTS